MHLENGRIIPDTPSESIVIGQAEIEGELPLKRYPRIGFARWSDQVSLMERLEDGPRENSKAVVRGLTRIAMSQKSSRAVAIDVLSQLAEEAIKSLT